MSDLTCYPTRDVNALPRWWETACIIVALVFFGLFLAGGWIIWSAWPANVPTLAVEWAQFALMLFGDLVLLVLAGLAALCATAGDP